MNVINVMNVTSVTNVMNVTRDGHGNRTPTMPGNGLLILSALYPHDEKETTLCC